MQVEIAEGLSITWDIKLEYLHQDSIFKKVKAQYDDYRPLLLAALEDTALTDFDVCGKQKKLRKGDFAWMLLRELGKIPPECSIRLYNTYRGMCLYPVGFLDHFEESRREVAKEIRNCAY